MHAVRLFRRNSATALLTDAEGGVEEWINVTIPV